MPPTDGCGGSPTPPATASLTASPSTPTTAAGPFNDEDAPFALRTTTYQLRDGLAQPVESTEEQLDELPDLDGPVIDCDR